MVNEEHLPTRVPDVLFQYCGGSAIDIFEKKRIKCSTPSSLNDPFEWKPSVDEEVTPDQKSREWEYEEEWRLLIDVKHLRKDRETTNPNLYLPIPPHAIDQIIFGSRCSDTLVSKIDATLGNTPEFNKVRRFKARLDPKLFKIFVEKL